MTGMEFLRKLTYGKQLASPTRTRCGRQGFAMPATRSARAAAEGQLASFPWRVCPQREIVAPRRAKAARVETDLHADARVAADDDGGDAGAARVPA